MKLLSPELTVDRRFHYVDGVGRPACCDLKVWRRFFVPGGAVVLVAEREDNPGMSVTNSAPGLQAAVAKDLSKIIDPKNTSWLEKSQFRKADAVMSAVDEVLLFGVHQEFDGQVGWRPVSWSELEALLGSKAARAVGK